MVKNDFRSSLTEPQQTVHDSSIERLIKIGKLGLVFTSLLSGLIHTNVLQEIHTKWAIDYLYVDYLLFRLTAELPEPLNYNFM